MARQCAWCGLMLSGPRAGERLPKQALATHTQCEACHAEHERQRAARKGARVMPETGERRAG
jgi:uncharacterized protein (DUF983 family)